jgi:tagatose 1,6-diphosphate aldolase GatY/KbaY
VLSSFADILTSRKSKTAVGAFSCYNHETAEAVLQAAAGAEAAVILMIGARSYSAPGGDLFLGALIAAAERSAARACVQLDHCNDLPTIESALAAGAGAAMADGSALPYEQNVAFVRDAVEIASQHGASIEAELGAITGDEDIAEAVAAGALTDPDQATDFVAQTGADCLAVSIGNVHGLYRNPPDLDWQRLEAIHQRVSQPLSLHGASGIPDLMIRRSIELGVAKVNVNTELRQAYLTATQVELPSALEGWRLDVLHHAQVRSVADAVEQRLEAFQAGDAE